MALTSASMQLLHPARTAAAPFRGPCTGLALYQRRISGGIIRCQSANSDETAADILAETEKLLAELGKSSTHPALSSGYQSDDESPAFVVSCDVNGCIISSTAPSTGPAGMSSPMLPQMGRSSEHPAGPVDFEFHEGNGWKIGFDAGMESDETYSAMVGSDDFSIALTRPEFTDFVQLVKNLRRSVTTLEICGEWGEAGNEATLEMETKQVWMQGRAPQKRLSTLQDWWRNGEGSAASMDGEDLSAAFALRFIVKTQGAREVEGNWFPESVMDFFSFLDSDAGEFLRAIQSETPGLVPAAQES